MNENAEQENPELNISRAVYHSPIGILEILSSDHGIVSLRFRNDGATEPRSPENSRPSLLGLEKNEAEDFITSSALGHLKTCLRQLDEYFTGGRDEFTVPLDVQGPEFHEKVWRELLEIPCGEVKSYKDIAERLGNPGAARAVGSANNKNKIAILIPCHRVIGADGKMVGYASGAWRKEWLLKHEAGLAGRTRDANAG